MNVNAMFKGDHLSAAEIEGRTPTWVIDRVEQGELEDEKGKKQSRPIVYFRGSERGWVLNRTNAQALIAMFGAEGDKWPGKRVTLYATEVQLGKEKTLGMRVRGSPDLMKPVTFTLRLPRKRPQQVTLTPTVKGQTTHPPAVPSQVEEAADILGGEVSEEAAP